MLVIVTGPIGVGKSAVCRKLVDIVRARGYTCGGILTYKAADQGIAIEDIESGVTGALASIDEVYPGPRTGRYFFNPEGIDFGKRAIDRGTSKALLVVDEIGHLELRGEGFANTLELIKENKVGNCVLVIREELLPGFKIQLPIKPVVFKTTVDNRNQLPQEIGSVLLEKLQ
jgi:nucleoside-triphosphatase THEP1